MLHTLKKLIPQAIKNTYHLLCAMGACLAHGCPARRLRIVAVTGTDGKTTTVTMIARILRASGRKVALASTLEFCIGEECQVNSTKFTTLSSWKLQAFLRRAVREECDVVVLEVSSHSLDQNRIWGVRPEISVLTNITREHLDYHKTMKRYREAKKKLFLRSTKSIINATLKDREEFIMGLDNVFWYGIYENLKGIRDDSVVRASDIQWHEEGITFCVEDAQVCLHVPGTYNMENALASMAVAKLLGVNLREAGEALGKIQGVPGRFELVPNTKDITIIIDYAVTPEALTKVYQTISSMRRISKGRIISVFGACGDRDRGKRPIMGRIVDRVADIIILTDEDPYWEDPKQILDEVAMGITKKKPDSSLFRIYDREEAIRKALSLARKGDIVVITGKGAEENISVRGKLIPWNDKRAVKKILRENSKFPQ